MRSKSYTRVLKMYASTLHIFMWRPKNNIRTAKGSNATGIV